MKRVIFFFSLFIVFTGRFSAQENVDWMTMDEALEAQKKDPKKIIMDAYTDWCPPCKMMEERTYHHPQVVHYINKHFYPVKFNAEGQEEIHYRDRLFTNPKYDSERKDKQNYQHLLARYLKINAYPTTVFFDEDAEVITAIRGYRSPWDLEIYLKMVAGDDYKEITSKKAWKTYKKHFKPTFEN